ncbi:MAG TPA: hypothetical protein VGG72_09305 [Bryobacteraceae bacterium]|jgi:hypothetical protein
MGADHQTLDYAAMLADMEAKYAALGGAISSLRAALASGALGALSDVPTSSTPGFGPISGGAGISLPRGAFLGKAATEAIKLYLGAVRKKQTNKEIAQALRDGGLESTGNFDNYVTGGLFRLKNDGVVLRFDDGWGLAEWYPESFRSRVTEKTSGGQRKLRKKTQRKGKPKGPTERAPKIAGLDERILELFEGQTGGGTLDAEIVASLLGANPGAVNMGFGRLRKKGKLEKVGDGYRLPLVEVAQVS